MLCSFCLNDCIPVKRIVLLRLKFGCTFRYNRYEILLFLVLFDESNASRFLLAFVAGVEDSRIHAFRCLIFQHFGLSCFFRTLLNYVYIDPGASLDAREMSSTMF